jgi:translation initiation factor 2A
MLFPSRIRSADYFPLDRSQKSLGLVNGAPDYTPVAGFADPDVPAKTQSYSVDGRLYAYALTSL